MADTPYLDKNGLGEFWTAIKDYMDELYVTKDHTGSATIAANTTGAMRGDITLSGYTPIGIIRIQKSGTNASYCTIARFHFSTTEWVIGLYNNRNAEATCNVTVTVLYKKL